MLSLSQAELPLLLILPLTLFAGIACLECSLDDPVDDRITIDATCYPNGRIEWLANVMVQTDTVRIVYNCTGPYTGTGILLPGTRNGGPTESGTFQVPEWDYRTSICYLDGCYQEFAAGFPKYSISTTPCTVIFPSSVMDESSSVSSQDTTVIPDLLVPSSVTEEPTSVSPQLTTSHLPVVSSGMTTPQPSPAMDPNSRTNDKKETKITLIVVPSVSLVILVLFLCFTCLLTFFAIVQRRLQKAKVDIRYFTDGGHEEVADHVVHIVAFRQAKSKSMDTIYEALCVEEKAYEEKADDEESVCSIVLESSERREQEVDANSECTTCSLYEGEMATCNHQMHSAEEYVHRHSFIGEPNAESSQDVGAFDDQSIQLESLVDAESDLMPWPPCQLDRPHTDSAEEFLPAQTHVHESNNRKQAQDGGLVYQVELPQGYGQLVRAEADLQLPQEDGDLVQQAQFSRTNVGELEQSAEGSGRSPQLAEICQTDIWGQPQDDGMLQAEEDSGFNSNSGYIKFIS